MPFPTPSVKKGRGLSGIAKWKRGAHTAGFWCSGEQSKRERSSKTALRMGGSSRRVVKIIGWQEWWAGHRPSCLIYWWNLDPSFSRYCHVDAT